MSAADHLQGRQFFHTSPVDFKPGDTLKPASEVGSAYDDEFYVGDHEWRQHRVWLAGSEHDAAEWSVGHRDINHVYEVEPHDVQRHRPHEDMDPEDMEQFHAARATVKRVVRPAKKPGAWGSAR